MKYLPRRLHLRNRTDFERCTDKVNSGISRSQRLLNNGNHLCSFRIQRQDAFGRRDAERVWTGSRKRRSQQCAHIAGFLAEMKRFELLRRFEPTYRISSADPSTTWVHLQICRFTRRNERTAKSLPLGFVPTRKASLAWLATANCCVK